MAGGARRSQKLQRRPVTLPRCLPAYHALQPVRTQPHQQGLPLAHPCPRFLRRAADCCDGSDEPAGACPYRCKQLGAEALKSLVAEVAAAEAGVRAKQKYIEEAAGLKKGWQQRLDKLEAEVAAQQAVVDAAQGEDGGGGGTGGGRAAAGGGRERRPQRGRARRGGAGEGLQRADAQGEAVGKLPQDFQRAQALPGTGSGDAAGGPALQRLIAVYGLLCLVAATACAWASGLGSVMGWRRAGRPGRRRPRLLRF